MQVTVTCIGEVESRLYSFTHSTVLPVATQPKQFLPRCSSKLGFAPTVRVQTSDLACVIGVFFLFFYRWPMILAVESWSNKYHFLNGSSCQLYWFSFACVLQVLILPLQRRSLTNEAERSDRS
eukprot:4405790-Amphidinium_carterae.1